MTSDVEKYLFGSFGTHALVSFLLDKGQLKLTIAPWTDLSKTKVFLFENGKIMSTEALSEGNLPFDIIGIDHSKVASDIWRFCIHCSEREYVFEGKWPVRLE